MMFRHAQHCVRQCRLIERAGAAEPAKQPLVGLCPEIVELDLNPVIVTTHGAIVVDARIRLD